MRIEILPKTESGQSQTFVEVILYQIGKPLPSFKYIKDAIPVLVKMMSTDLD